MRLSHRYAKRGLTDSQLDLFAQLAPAWTSSLGDLIDVIERTA